MKQAGQGDHQCCSSSCSSKTQTVRLCPTTTGPVARYVKVPSNSLYDQLLNTCKLGSKREERGQADQKPCLAEQKPGQADQKLSQAEQERDQAEKAGQAELQCVEERDQADQADQAGQVDHQSRDEKAGRAEPQCGDGNEDQAEKVSQTDQADQAGQVEVDQVDHKSSGDIAEARDQPVKGTGRAEQQPNTTECKPQPRQRKRQQQTLMDKYLIQGVNLDQAEQKRCQAEPRCTNEARDHPDSQTKESDQAGQKPCQAEQRCTADETCGQAENQGD